MRFDDFPLRQELKRALSETGMVTLTPVQERCIPVALEGSDIVGVAQTGTGKTLAFLVPIFERLVPKNEPQALIVCPTRELAQQVGKVARELGAAVGVRTTILYGGTGLGAQREQLDENPDLIVGTPGRLIDFLSSAWLRPKSIGWLVLDEADRMLDMGFIDDVVTICSRVPLSRQTMLFSATMPPAIASLTERFMYHPVTVRIEPEQILATGIRHHVYIVSEDDKQRALDKVMRSHRGRRTLVFTATRESTSEIASRLRRGGHEVVSLSSLLSQNNRERALAGFRDGEYNVMVATDVASRGLDVVDIDLVINYDMPQAAEDYVHRVGRTGRAEKKGEAFSFATPRDKPRLDAIEAMLGEPVRLEKLEGFDAPDGSAQRSRGRSRERGRGGRSKAGERNRSGADSSRRRRGRS